jgi:hypothetical protein
VRLADFEITAGAGFRTGRALQLGSAMEREFNCLARGVSEEVRFAIGARLRIEAPFNKLIVSMLNSEAEPPPDAPGQRVEDMLNVVQVTVDVRESDLRGDRERRHAALLDATDYALSLLRQELGWRSPEMEDIVRELRQKPTLGLIEIESLARLDRKTHRRARTFYVVSDAVTAVDVAVEDGAGVELRRERVAESSAMLWLEAFFPVRTAVMKDGVFLLRDRTREPLAAVLMRDTVDLSPRRSDSRTSTVT